MKKLLPYLLLLLCFSAERGRAQTPEAEPNNTLATANNITYAATVTGQLLCTAGDNDDYFQVVLPAGTKSLRLITKAKTQSGTGAVYCYLYNKYGVELTNYYQSLTTAWKTDTLDYTCFEGDTFFVRMYNWNGGCKDYEFKTGTAGSFLAGADPEGNDAFATATPLGFNFDTSGHLANQRYGPVAAFTDNNDYYRVVPPAGNKGLRLTSKWRTATPGGTGAVYVYLYNKFQQELTYKYIPFGNAWVTDTLDYPCFEGDTFFVRMYNWNGGCKEYRMRAGTPNLYTVPNDAESNDSFAAANTIPFNADTSGHLASQRYGAAAAYTDNNDYYRVVPPAGNKGLRLTSKWHTTTPGGTGAVYVYLYNKFQQELTNKYIPFGNAWVTDTLDYPCFEGDTFFVRMYNWNGACKEYQMKAGTPNLYTVSNDAENNDGFSTATAIPFSTDTSGHLASQRYGPATAYTDNNDYYRVVPPTTNRSLRLRTRWHTTTPGGTGAVYVYLYNKFQQELTYKYIPFGNAWVTDTLDYPCFEGDTFFVRMYNWNGACKEYQMKAGSANSFLVSDDPEVNDDFATATPLTINTDTSGHLASQRYGATTAYTDNNDYYRVVTPAGYPGLRLTSKWHTTTPGGTGAVYVYLYNKFQQELTSRYISFGNAWVTDTLDYPCFEGDTFFVRMYNWNGGCKEYQLRTTTNSTVFMPLAGDTEPNNSLATASFIALTDTLKGRIGHTGTGLDNYDYFRFKNEERSKITAYVTYNNGAKSNASLYFYFQNKSGGTLLSRPLYNRPPGEGRDTLVLNCAPADTLALQVTASSCFSYQVHFKVKSEQPTAKIIAARTGPEYGFTAESRVADTLTWDFGNGQKTGFPYPTKTFAPGNYTVTLKATNRGCNLSASDTLQLEVQGIEKYMPRKAGAGGDLLMTVYGGGLTDNTTVKLILGSTVVTPLSVRSNDKHNMLVVDFDLHLVQPGTYDVEITLPGATPVRYAGGMVIEKLSYPYCKAEVVGPTRWRINRETPFELKITNSGNVFANGAVVGIAWPKSVQVDFTPKLARLNLGGTTTVEVNGEKFSASNADMAQYYDAATAPTAITSFEGKPYDGYFLYLKIPKVPAGATVTIPFTALTTGVGAPSFRTYTHHPNVFGSCGTSHWSNQSNMMVSEAIDAADMAADKLNAPGPLKGLIKATKIGQKHLALAGANAGARFDAWWNGYEMNAEMYGILNAELDEANAFALQTATDEAGSALFAHGMGKLKNANLGKNEFWNKTMANNQNLSPEVFDQFLDKINALDKSVKRLDKLEGMFKNVKDLKSLADKLATLEQLVKECPELQQQLEELKKLLNEEADHKDPKEKPTQSVVSLDPNAIYGPDGVLDERYRKDGDPMHYMISCENVDTAGAAAQVVRIVDTLDPAKFDLSTFEFGNVYIGKKAIRLLSGRDEFYGELSLAPEMPLKARIIAKLNQTTGVIIWDMVGVDSLTGKLPFDPDLGLLPPNTAPPIGEAFVSYSVRLKAGLPSGTVVRNTAHIYFDENEPIATNTWSNTLDIVKPQSSLSATVVNDSMIKLQFTGTDTESGILKYRLFVQTDTLDWRPLGIAVTDTMLIGGAPGQTYRFSVSAIDNVGNNESKLPRNEAQVTVPPAKDAPGGPAGGNEPFVLYPNPSTGQLFIRPNADRMGATLAISDYTGRVVASSVQDFKAGNVVLLNLDNLANGMYLIRISGGGGSTETYKVVLAVPRR